ncbi:hypothetical protein [Spirosoma endbachense]|uniref:Uncharacterized protein n=1 Tax=Spirosoma endbachense TaxID=2666025 RepID=A0A6P1VU02_9BACT|nr:hypothetical protein [Spirosoma endbachense]QHV96563.1 hypothetical protein GJR95_16765 [Spirosoma endbachense]
MRQTILDQIATALANCKKHFIREQDIQFYLYTYFLQSGNYDNVFYEYHVPSELMPPYLWNDVHNIYIDIVLEKNNEFYPIEIKYKTTKEKLSHLVFGQNVNVLLGHHGAQNIGCYDFWKDIKRIEYFEEVFHFVKRGIVIFASNDPSYMKPPRNTTIGYAPFSIHQGRNVAAGTQLNWNGAGSTANGRPGFTVNHDYTISWIKLPFQHHYYILA